MNLSFVWIGLNSFLLGFFQVFYIYVWRQEPTFISLTLIFKEMYINKTIFTSNPPRFESRCQQEFLGRHP